MFILIKQSPNIIFSN